MQLLKQTDEEYFNSSYGFNIDDSKSSVITASVLKKSYSMGLYEAIIEEEIFSEQTLDAFRRGTILHSAILEPQEFSKRYYIGDFNPVEDKEQVEDKIASLVDSIKKQINLKYPFISDSQNAEVTIIGKLDGVNVKAKIDKYSIEKDRVIIYDLKSTFLKMAKLKRDRNGALWEIKRAIDEYNIDLQLYFYKTLIEQYLQEKNILIDVICRIVFVSTADNKARMVELSPEIIGRGEEKFKSIWQDVKNFVENGLKIVNMYEIV